MSNIIGIIEALEGIANDIRNEVILVDGNIDRDDYLETMIGGPVGRARAAERIGDAAGARTTLEVAVHDLLTDFDGEVLTADGEDFDSADYAETVLRPLVTTTCGMSA